MVAYNARALSFLDDCGCSCCVAPAETVVGSQVWTQLMTDVAADPWMSASVIFDILKCAPCSFLTHDMRCLRSDT